MATLTAEDTFYISADGTKTVSIRPRPRQELSLVTPA